MSSDSGTPRLDVTRGGGFTVARVVGCDRLDEMNADQLRSAAAGLVEGRDQHLILDLAGISFLGSVALAKFVALNKVVRAAGGKLTLVNLNPAVREVFAVTRLDAILDVRGVPSGRSGTHARLAV